MFAASTQVVGTEVTPLVTLPNSGGTIWLQLASGETIAVGGPDVTYATGLLILGVATTVVQLQLDDLAEADTLYGIASGSNKTIRILARTSGKTQPIFGVLP